MANRKYRSWCFTINNDIFSDLEGLLQADFEYLLFGFEVGKECGTPHIQGYIRFINAIRMPSVKLVMPRANVRPARGTPRENFTYCSKDDDWYEFGERPEPGKISYERMLEVMENPKENFYLYHQYRRAFKELVNTSQNDWEERSIYIVDEARLFFVIKGQTDISLQSETYDGEELAVVSSTDFCTDQMYLIWANNFAAKYKYGFEIRTYDPRAIYVTCQTTEAIKRTENYCRKHEIKYSIL